MSMTTSSSRTSSVQWLIESRPPSLTWARPSPQPSNQPPLQLIDHEFDHADDLAENHRGVRLSTVKARWAARPLPGLPDAQEWSTTLALAVIQALVGRRPVAQLNRWIVEDVLAAISIYQRRHLREHGLIAVPIAVHSVRVQHPDPAVAEVAAHMVIAKRSVAMAFRLEALGDRWLCTALELGPHRRLPSGGG
ncbi:MAG TPA: Rv3235 family protein [Propionibacteriaceae bacterium]|nr:Rv3235 family protein [Propionibacteriaceae bacterium]